MVRFDGIFTGFVDIDEIHRVGGVISRSIILGCVVLDLKTIIASVGVGCSDLIGEIIVVFAGIIFVAVWTVAIGDPCFAVLL